jgi:hypothetical protein
LICVASTRKQKELEQTHSAWQQNRRRRQAPKR